MLVYEDRRGLCAGAALKGGAVTPAGEANHIYYGKYVSMSDILFGHKVQATAAAIALANTLQAFSKNVPAGSKAAEKQPRAVIDFQVAQLPALCGLNRPEGWTQAAWRR